MPQVWPELNSRKYRIQEHARIRAREFKVSRETVSPLRQSPRMPLNKSKLRADGRPAQVVEATLRRRFVPLSYV